MDFPTLAMPNFRKGSSWSSTITMVTENSCLSDTICFFFTLLESATLRFPKFRQRNRIASLTLQKLPYLCGWKATN